jgi:predicted PurR-regulated permease PerM
MKTSFGDIFIKIYKVILPISIAFLISYIIYPTYKKLNKYLPSIISIIVIYIAIFLFIVFTIYLIIPNSALIKELTILSKNIITFITNLSIKYNLDVNVKDILLEKANYIINQSISLISNVISFILNTILVLILSIYFIINMDKIKKFIKKKFNKYYTMLKEINIELYKYFNATIKILIIQFFEYTTVYYLIGHPNFLLLGILNSITSIIPMVGTLMTGVIALITASVVSKELFILTSIMILILPNIDAYLITPKIYKDSNKISPFISILAIFVGGTLFGFIGILLFIPVTIIMSIIIRHTKIIKM